MPLVRQASLAILQDMAVSLRYTQAAAGNPGQPAVATTTEAGGLPVGVLQRCQDVSMGTGGCREPDDHRGFGVCTGLRVCRQLVNHTCVLSKLPVL